MVVTFLTVKSDMSQQICQSLIYPGGRAGVSFTLKTMIKEIKRGKQQLAVMLASRRVVENVPQKNWRGEVEALFYFVKDHIRYTRDINGIETIQSPTATLLIRQGDCDDKSILLAAMLESIGHPTRVVAIGTDGKNFRHVFIETKIGNKWIALDPTEPYRVGQAPPIQNPRIVRHVK